MANATRTITRTERVRVAVNVETHVLPSGAQARQVTRIAAGQPGAGQFIATVALTGVNPK